MSTPVSKTKAVAPQATTLALVGAPCLCHEARRKEAVELWIQSGLYYRTIDQATKITSPPTLSVVMKRNGLGILDERRISRPEVLRTSLKLPLKKTAVMERMVEPRM